MRELPDSLLERLALAAQRSALGERPGVMPSPLVGQGQEIAGHRPYAIGDDPRRIDGRAWARLDRPVVRTLRREREQRLHLVLDRSASMGAVFPERFERAKELTLGLAALGLAALEDVRISTLGSDAATLVGNARGRRAVSSIRTSLEGLRSDGSTRLDRLAPLLRGAPRGLCLVITDFLDDASPADWVSALEGPGSTWVLALRHPRDPLDISPGGAEIVDPESGRHRELSIDAAVLDAARDRLLRRDRERALALAGAGIQTITLDSAEPVEQLLLGSLRQKGLLVVG